MMVTLWFVLIVSVHSMEPFYKRMKPTLPSGSPRRPAPPSRPHPRPYNAQSFTLWNGNMAIDILLEVARKQLIHIGRNIIEIPEVDESFDLGNFHFNFQMNEARVEDLATLYRTSDVMVKQEADGSLFAAAGLGFRRLAVVVGHYSLTMNKRIWKGKMSVQMTRNSVKASATVKLNGNGLEKFMVHKVKFNKLSGIKIRISGLGVCGYLLTRFVGGLLNLLNRLIAKLIEYAIKQQLDEMLKDGSLFQT